MAIFFQGEVACVEQVKLKVLEVPLVRLSAFGWKNGILGSPHDQRRWLMLAEVFLPLRVQGWVRSVAMEQLQLNFLIALTIQQRLHVTPSVRADRFDIANAVGVLPLRRIERDNESQRVFVRQIRVVVSSFDVFPKRVIEALIHGTAIFPRCVEPSCGGTGEFASGRTGPHLAHPTRRWLQDVLDAFAVPGPNELPSLGGKRTLLAEHLLELLSRRLGKQPTRLTRANVAELGRYDWPGNSHALLRARKTAGTSI